MMMRAFRVCLLSLVVMRQCRADTTRSGVNRFKPSQACTCRSSVVCDPPGSCTCIVHDEVLSSCRCGFNSASRFSTTLCAETTCCAGRGGRDRQLLGADIEMDPEDPVHQELYKSYLERCGQYEYQTYLHVTHHMYAVAVPPNDGEEPCPFLVTHSHFESRHHAATKKLLFWETKEDGEARFADGNWRGTSMPVGSFKLSELARAYEAVDLPSVPFDAVTNNCGHYIIHLALQLGIKIDHRMMSFVTQRLMEEASSGFMKDLKGRLGSFWSTVYEWIQHYLGFLWGAAAEETEDDSSKGALLESLVTQQAAQFQ